MVLGRVRVILGHVGLSGVGHKSWLLCHPCLDQTMTFIKSSKRIARTRRPTPNTLHHKGELVHPLLQTAYQPPCRLDYNVVEQGLRPRRVHSPKTSSCSRSPRNVWTGSAFVFFSFVSFLFYTHQDISMITKARKFAVNLAGSGANPFPPPTHPSAV